MLERLLRYSAVRIDRMRIPIRYAAGALAFAAAISLHLTSCIGSRPRTCSNQSDCSSLGAVCDGHGFCATECTTDGDCPCNSFCAAGCGICVRNDLAGTATCFGQNRDMTPEAILHACGVREPPDAALLSADAADGRACIHPNDLPQCNNDPPIVYSPRDASGDALPVQSTDGSAPDGTSDIDAADGATSDGGAR